MAADPYATLGVPRGATPEQIRTAYRKLAKEHHPDHNAGNKAAEAKFKTISAAHDILGDSEKRGRFDRGEIDGNGEPAAGAAHRGYGGRPGAGAADMGDVFADLFARQNRAYTSQPARGRDTSYTLAVSFVDAVAGCQQTLTLPEGRVLDVRIPAGFADGQTLRLRGQGAEGHKGGPPGDALIEVRVRPHPLFRREGDDILVDIPVTLKEAVLGARITVPTPSGAVTVTVPKRSDSGTVLRLRGRGVPAHEGRPAGDQRVTLRIVVGDADAALEAFLEGWKPKTATDPRASLTGG